ncbi:3-hydroxyacyl-ACP dehydratase FabZ [Candidatus Gromoviella agglomerans]|uniref:3-hydroxyacyl-ACP dehydratase FabZ n=1 Tax=Candidatus Gromoviella agglomerans TaxID=2806609 RepID=UPI001E4C1075|nr:3-hydroxyacyl-ACP dehydratase FabZ [Candidatus Gromoviella agglomerans]
MKEVFIDEIIKILPHSYPMLLLDRVIDVCEDYSATGIKCVSFNEWFFQGHFKQEPVMPGVLILEAMAQTCIVTFNCLTKKDSKIAYLSSITDAKFKKKVVPGDLLQLYVKKIKELGDYFLFSCEAKVEGDVVAIAKVGAFIS